MDASESLSGAKTNFSIERILSEDSKRSRDELEPSWLCCTRYRPPRLPRASTSAYRSRRSGRHARVPFTASQAAALEAAFARAPYLAPPALRALASALQLRDDRIKIWFQNRRARERREKCAAIMPPSGITLPSNVPAHIMVASNDVWETRQAAHSSITFHDPDRSHNIITYGSDSEHENSNRFQLPLVYDQNHFEDNYEAPTGEECETPLDIETIDE